MMKRLLQSNRRAGFTLVEMLVAVTLVLLMMSMFASIFQMASESLSTQRGIANNDQKARAFAIRLRSDLDKRTFRSVIPFFQNEDANTSPNSFASRQGYFYLSTNDPSDSSDHVLQFTVNAHVISKNQDETPYYGKGTQLLSDDGLMSVSDRNGDGMVDLRDALLESPNQPEADDANVEPNGTATSPVAEVSYFLRGGNLYRRVLLVREPMPLAGQETEPQPTRADGVDFFDLDSNPATTDYYTEAALLNGVAGNFWTDFDHAAFRFYDAMGVPGAAKFHGLESLNNEAAGSTFFSLGKPQFRWGHNTVPGPLFGMPREFTVLPGAAVPPLFIGRFLHEETSFVHPSTPGVRFGYPQENCVPFGGSPTNGHPMDTAATPLSLNTRHIVQQFSDATGTGGPRRAEELLLPNVHEFRVEIWDDRLRKFTTPGHGEINSVNGQPGDFHSSRNWNPAYGPFGPTNANRVFDTWHPAVNGGTNLGSSTQAPLRAMTFYPPRLSDTPAGPAPATMPGPFAPNIGASPAPALHPYWTPNADYDVGDVVFPLTNDVNDNNILDFGEDVLFGFPADGQVHSHGPSRPSGFSYHYRCVQGGRSRAITTPAEHATNAPAWQNREGALISEDTNGNGVPGEPGEPIWIAVPNLRPVRAIRVTLRVFDPGTEQMRQVSITHSLRD